MFKIAGEKDKHEMDHVFDVDVDEEGDLVLTCNGENILWICKCDGSIHMAYGVDSEYVPSLKLTNANRVHIDNL